MHSVPLAIEIHHRKNTEKLGNAATSEIDVFVHRLYARLANSTKKNSRESCAAEAQFLVG